MKITAQTMRQDNLELSIESSCGDKWDITIYRDAVEEDETPRVRLMSDYLTVKELEALEDMFRKARYLAQENTEEQK